MGFLWTFGTFGTVYRHTNMLARIALFSGLSLIAALADNPTQLTPAVAITERRISELRFSPDGSRVAFVVSEPIKGTTPQSHIWVLYLPTREVRQFTSSAKTEREPRWSPDGRTLAFLSDREERMQIWKMPADGGEATRVTSGKNGVQSFRWSPEGKTIAFLSGEPKDDVTEKKEKDKDDARVEDRDERPARLWTVNLADEKVHQVSKAPWKVDEMEWLPAGDRLLAIATDKPESDQLTEKIVTITVADGAVKVHSTPRLPAHGLRVAPDGTQFGYVGTPGEGPQAHDLWIQAVSGGEARNISGKVLDQAIMDFQWRDKTPVALVARGFGSNLMEIADGQAREALPKMSVTPAGFAMNAKGVVAFVGESSTRLPEVWLAESGKDPAPVTHFNRSLADLPLQPLELYKYKSFDGVQIEAGLLRPKGASAGAKLPTIVLVHGGPTGAWRDRFDAWGQLLVARGYAVFYPNIRGSIGYGEKFIEMNRNDWGGADFKDVMAGVDDLVNRGIADPDRLGIGGWSYGGYMSEWAITQTHRFKAAVSGAGLFDLAAEFGTERGPAYDEWFFGLPYEHPENFAHSSPQTFIKNARTPTLILQGENDTTDPMGQSQALYRALKRYGVKAELVLYPREPHGFREEKHRVDMLTRMVAWFDRYVNSGQGTAASGNDQ